MHFCPAPSFTVKSATAQRMGISSSPFSFTRATPHRSSATSSIMKRLISPPSMNTPSWPFAEPSIRLTELPLALSSISPLMSPTEAWFCLMVGNS